MPGPRTSPSDVKSPIPKIDTGDYLNSDQARFALVSGQVANLPDMPENAGAAPASPMETAPSGGVEAPTAGGPAPASDPQAEVDAFVKQFGIPDEGAASADQFAASLGLTQGAPTDTSGDASATETAASLGSAFLPGPLQGLVGAIQAVKAGPGGLSPVSRAKAQLGKSPEESRRILESLGYETRIADGAAQYRKPGEPAFRPLDPKGSKTLAEAFSDIADILPDLAQGAVEGAATTAGATAGFAAAGPAGAYAGGAAAGGAAAYAGMKARDAFIRGVLGVTPTEASGLDTALAVGGGVLGGGLAAHLAIRSAPKAVASLLRSIDETGAGATAKKAEGLITEATETVRDLVHPVPVSKLTAGEAAQTAVERLDNDLGERVGFAWDVLKSKVGDGRIVPEGFKAVVEDLLTSPTSVAKGDPGVRRVLMGYWNQLEKGGFTPGEFERVLKDLKGLAGYGAGEKNFAQLAMGKVRQAAAGDRDRLLMNAVKGTDAEGYVSQAFSGFAEKIDAIREMERLAERAPERFANALFNDTKGIALARDVFADSPEVWAKLQSSWLQGHIEKATVDKIGMTDIRQLFNSLAKNPDVAVEILGPERFKSLKNLAASWDKLDTQMLLDNPNSSRALAFVNGVVRTVAMRSPGQAAVTINSLFGGNDKVIRALQSKGLSQFVKDAANGGEKTFWLKTAEALDKIRAASIVEGSVGDIKYRVPVEQGILSPVISAALRGEGEHPDAHVARMVSTYDDVSERERLRAIREAPTIAMTPTAGSPAKRGKMTSGRSSGRMKSTLPKFGVPSRR